MQGFPLVAASLVLLARLGLELRPRRGASGASAARSLAARVGSVVAVALMTLVWWSRGVLDRDALGIEEWVGLGLVAAGIGIRRLANPEGARASASDPARATPHPFAWVLRPECASTLLVEVGLSTFFAAWIFGLPLLMTTARSLGRPMEHEERQVV